MGNTDFDEVSKKAEKIKVTDLPVGSFMTKSVLNAKAGSSISATIKFFQAHKISGAPVVDDDGRLQGIISEYDLLIQAATKNLTHEIDYTINVLTLKVDSTLKEALVLLYKNKLKRIPVIGANKTVVGIVTRIDILEKLIEKH